MSEKAFSTTYSSTGVIPTTTYGDKPSTAPSFDLHGLSPGEAQRAIMYAAMEKEAAKQRGVEHRKMREAHLRKQGFDEEYIRTH